METLRKNIDSILVILLLVIALFILYQMKGCSDAAQKSEVTENPLQTVHDTVKIVKNDTKIEYQKDVTEINSLKELIKILRGDSSENKTKSLILATELEITKNELAKANEKLYSLIKLNSELSLTIEDLKAVDKGNGLFLSSFKSLKGDWYNGTAEFNLNDTTFNIGLKTYDKFSITQYQKDGHSFVKVTNENPFSTVTGLNEFKISVPKVKQRRLGLGIIAGYGGVYNRGNVNFGFGLMGGLYYRLL